MKVRISSIPMMFEYLSKLNTEPADIVLVNELFNHEDYQFEIRRYGLSSIEHLVFYFSRLKSIKEEEI